MSTPNLSLPETILAPVVPPAGNSTSPLYGWRYVQRTRPDGSISLEEVPLTLEDVLHPREGDVIAENTVHEPERGHLAGACRTRLDRIHNGQVFSDCIIDWNVPGLGNHSPDVSVFENIRDLPLPKLGTYRVADHGGRCLLVVEIVSPETRTNDVDRKPEHYHRAGVGQYVVIDQERSDGPRQIVNRRWERDGYVVEEAADGHVRLESLGLLLGLRDNRVVVTDAATGDEIGELAQEHAGRRRETEARLRAERRTRREARARQQAEDRVHALEEEIRRLRGEPKP